MKHKAFLPALLAPLLLTTPASGKDITERAEIPNPEACPAQTNHKDYRVEVGSGKDRNQADALKEAREDAYRKLKEQVCQGVSAERCHANSRNIRPFGAGEFDRRANSACASVAIHVDNLNSIEKDLEELDATLTGMAEVVKAAVAGAPVKPVEPTWASSGCAAGEDGAHLLNRLRQRMVGVQVLDPADEAPGMKLLRLSLSSTSGRVGLSLAMRDPDSPGWTQLDVGAPYFPADLFSLDPDELGSCATHSALGLEGERRNGSGGLYVSLNVPPPAAGGAYCEGERIAPKMALNQDALVRVYTVDADGQGYLVYSSLNRPEYAARPTDLSPPGKEWTMTVPPSGHDSQLVIVAVPPGSTFGSPEQTDNSMCRLTRPLHVSQFPPEAAVHVVSSQVLAADNPLCVGVGDAAAAAAAVAAAAGTLAEADQRPCP